MARIIGDHRGTTFSDFLVLPGVQSDGKSFTPEDVDISTDVGVKLKIPFLAAAMRSVTGKDLALAAGKLGMMAVAPRGLSTEKEAEIVSYVKENAVKVGDIEPEYSPTTILETGNLGMAIERARKTGHSNIPVVSRKSDFLGIFQYKPSKHDTMDIGMPITEAMQPYKGKKRMGVCKTSMSNTEVKKYLKENSLRFVPVVDEVGRLDRLVFLQSIDAYKVGAAIDTHLGWEERAEKLIEAGADMIFIDTSDAHRPFARKVLERYKRLFGEGPPICGGNVVTPEGFVYLAESGADAVKIGMGPGSICTTNEVLGVGAPPFWSLVEVARKRDEYALKHEYIPVIADGGIEGTGDIAVAMTHADGIMGGNIFGCFWESEGGRVDRQGKIYPRDMPMNEDNIVGIKIFGEGSIEARQTTGNMKRYAAPHSKNGVATFQGVSGWVPYKGMFKPGVEDCTTTFSEALYHAGARDLSEYRSNAVLIRLSDRAKRIAAPHGIEIIGD